MTSGHQLRFPRLAGDWAGAGIVFATPRVGVAVRVVSELGKHPGTKNGCQAGLAEVDLSVRVLTKMGLDLLLQGLDLRVQGDQDRYLGTYGRRIGGSDQLRQAQLRSAYWIACAFAATWRRRACCSEAVIWVMVNRAPAAGSAALANNSKASGAVRSPNAASAAG